MGIVVLAALAVLAVIVFLQTNPPGVASRSLLVYNGVTLALSLPVSLTVGLWLYADAVAAGAGGRGMAAYLAVMAAGAAALLVVAVGGLVRNFVVFPRSRRLPNSTG